jgi:hypothetical protein
LPVKGGIGQDEAVIELFVSDRVGGHELVIPAGRTGQPTSHNRSDG